MAEPIDVTPAILREIRDRVVHLDQRFDALEKRFEHRFDQVDQRLDQLDQRLEAVETVVIRHDRRLDAIEIAVGGLSAQVRMLAAGVTASLEFRAHVEARLDALENRQD